MEQSELGMFQIINYLELSII